MMTTIALGIAVWSLAFIGAGIVAGPVGIAVVAVFFVTASVLGIFAQRDLEAKYVVIKKDRDE